MLIIPALGIRGGRCVRLFQGDYGKETVYGEDPVAMAERWVAEGARFLHLVDLDGARDGIPRNKVTIQAIAKKSQVPVQVGGGIRDLATAEDYLSGGIRRIILGTAVLANPNFLNEACTRWPGRVAVDISRDGAQKGVNLQATREIARALKIPTIASGGISTIEDIETLLPLESDGVSAVIVGRALYAGTLRL